MSVLTPDVVASIPASAAELTRAAEGQEWDARARFVSRGTNGLETDRWVVGLDAETDEGFVELLLVWERGSRGFRYSAKASRGTKGRNRMMDMRLSTVAELVKSAELAEPHGECPCEDPDELPWDELPMGYEPRVCIEHAYCPDKFDPRFGWGTQIVRNGDLAGWDEGNTGGHYSPAEGEATLPLADVVPAEVRAAAEKAARPAEAPYKGRTAEEWAAVAEEYAGRATEAYECLRDVRNDLDKRLGVWLPLCDLNGQGPAEGTEAAEWRADAVPAWVDELYPTVRAALRRVDRRSITAHDCDCRARWEVRESHDAKEAADSRRAYELAERARVLADGCEADARLVTELYAWPEAEERAAEEIRRAEYSLADAEERYEAARRPGAFYDPEGRQLGITSALRLVWIARQALAAVNGSPYLAYPEMTDRGTVKRWFVGYCTVHPYAGTAVQIVDSSADQDQAEALADAKNQEHQEQQRAAAEEAQKATEALIAGAPAAVEAPVEEAPRYSFGRRDAEGRYPVSVDGVAVGHVYRTRRTWWALGLDETRPTDHTSRKAAAERLVGLVDVRAAVEADTARKMRRRTEAPAGWRVTTWDAVGPGDVVRTPRRCKPVRGDDGPLYPESWGAPVTLTGVEHLPNGCVVARGEEGGAPAWLGMGVLLSTPRDAEVGLLVADEEAREAPVEGAPAVPEAAAEAPVEEAAERFVEEIPASVGPSLSRRVQEGGSRGVLAGHSTRQGGARQPTRQGTRQPTRQGRARPGGRGRGSAQGGGRAPPSQPRPSGRPLRSSQDLTGARQMRRQGSGAEGVFRGT